METTIVVENCLLSIVIAYSQKSPFSHVGEYKERLSFSFPKSPFPRQPLLAAVIKIKMIMVLNSGFIMWCNEKTDNYSSLYPSNLK